MAQSSMKRRSWEFWGDVIDEELEEEHTERGVMREAIADHNEWTGTVLEPDSEGAMGEPTVEPSEKSSGEFGIYREFLEQDSCMYLIAGFGVVHNDFCKGAFV